jgi:hypothetical protein
MDGIAWTAQSLVQDDLASGGWYAPARRTMTFPSKSGYGARRRGNRRRPKHSGPGFSRRILPPAERAAAPETGAITLAVQKRALMPA